MKSIHCDALILGSGLAGQMLAHSLSSDHFVICLTKGQWNACNSYLAQGGIASVTSPDDNWLDHTQDTMLAGRFHNKTTQVQALTKESPAIIQKLVELGVPFDRDESGNYLRTREGGHHQARILHSGGDATGRHMMEALHRRLPPHVEIQEHTQALDLFIENTGCKGVWARDPKGELILYTANYTVLATGGLGQLFNHTTNAQTITGDGIAMAYRAGARCTDLEFVQFHPTLLNLPTSRGALISEAVRGEGAILVNQRNEPIMEGIHPLGDLAPRDVVAREIHKRILDGDKIFLDVSSILNFPTRFPTIAKLCSQAGLTIPLKRIPVSPGAHFIMGGIETNVHGQTTIPGLFAIGETAWTGVHGANRLASNSLLEAAGFAMRLGAYLNQLHKTAPFIDRTAPDIQTAQYHYVTLPSKESIQHHLSESLGIIRDPVRLLELKKWLSEWVQAYRNSPAYLMSKDQNERWNMITVADLMTQSMLERTESRGAHSRIDYPEERPDWAQFNILRERAVNESI